MNTFGKNLTLTTFGESHGEAIGGVIDGFPPRVHIDLNKVQEALDRRKPGQSDLTTARREPDRVRILSGMLNGLTTGTPIGFIIENTNQHSSDYKELEDTFRPSHADFTYQMKYGIRDHRGGGRSSARETACRVVGGAFCAQWLAAQGINIAAKIVNIGGIEITDEASRLRGEELIRQVKIEGDSIGGIIACHITGMPAGVGQPLFDRLNGLLAAAMFSIPAVKGVEFGMGFEGCLNRGSEMLDPFVPDGHGGITCASNHSGGIQGGISNGMPIEFRVAFKPVATLLRQVPTVNRNGEPVTLTARGRHDPCVLPRAVPIVEAMAALTIADSILSN